MLLNIFISVIPFQDETKTMEKKPVSSRKARPARPGLCARSFWNEPDTTRPCMQLSWS